MLWALLAAAGACANAAFFIFNKKFLERRDPYNLAASTFLGASVFLSACSVFLFGIPSITNPAEFTVALIITTVIYVMTTVFMYRALKSTDISNAVPMLSFMPIFCVGTTALIHQKYPSIGSVLGILIIVFGSYVLNVSEEHTSLIDPIKALVRNKGAIEMVGVAFLWAVAVNFENIMINNSTPNPILGSSIYYFLLGITFTLISVGQWYRIGRTKASVDAGVPVPLGSSDILRILQPFLLPALVIGLLTTIEEIVINTAYTQGFIPYVVAIKRMSILVVVFYGTVMINEREVLYRFAGATLMVIGAVTILLFH